MLSFSPSRAGLGYGHVAKASMTWGSRVGLRKGAVVVLFVLLLLPTGWSRVSLGESSNDQGSLLEASGGPSGRRLLATESGDKQCKPAKDWEIRGGFLAYLFGLAYVCVGMAIVSDEFFIPTLKVISEVCRLTEDVAGATFMAIGSSAPEVFSSAFSLANPDASNELGIGGITGSSVFNILVIVGASALASGKTVAVDWRAQVRDGFFYCASVLSIFAVFFNGVVIWWEGLVLTLCYAFYILCIAYNTEVLNLLAHCVSCMRQRFGKRESPELAKTQPSELPPEDELAPLGASQRGEQTENSRWKSAKMLALAERTRNGDGENNGDTNNLKSFEDVALRVVSERRRQGLHYNSSGLSLGSIRKIRRMMLEREEPNEALRRYPLPATDDEERHESDANEETTSGGGIFASLAPPREGFNHKLQWAKWAAWVIWHFLFLVTTPPCWRYRWRKTFPISFIVSIGWIGFLAYWLVVLASRLACILNAPPVVMGTIVLAGGTSVPDLMASIAVAREGMLDMAVANAVGSNILNFWVGLGLPWAVWLPAAEGANGRIDIDTRQLVPSVLILIGVAFAYYLPLALFGKWHLGPRFGYFLLGVYLLYVLYNVAFVWLLNIYGF